MVFMTNGVVLRFHEMLLEHVKDGIDREQRKKLVDEHIEVCRRMIAQHRQKIIELTRQRNQQDYFFESFDIGIINESGR
jgi:hypothetical protein